MKLRLTDTTIHIRDNSMKVRVQSAVNNIHTSSLSR